MTYEVLEYLDYNGHRYLTDTYPFEVYVTALGYRPFPKIWPNCFRGYIASWRIEDELLLMTSLNVSGESRVSEIFPDKSVPIPATWFSGLVHAWRGNRRDTGYPYRSFHNDEAIFEVESGEVKRKWILDLRAVPDQTDDEQRQSLPSFLWPERLK